MAGLPWRENVGEINLSDNDDEFLWLIPEPVYESRDRMCFASPWFSFDGVKWRLVISPSCGSEFLKGGDYTAMFLWISNYKHFKLDYNVRFGLRAGCGRTVAEYSGNKPSSTTYAFGRWDFLHKWNAGGKMSDCGRVAAYCVIQKIEQIPDNSFSIEEVKHEKEVDAAENGEDKKKDDVPEAKGVDRLVQNLKELLINEKSTDVLLKAEDREFRVHRAILIARSPVFACMFHHDTTEKTSGVVDIPDCSAEAFEAFLQYLYTGSADTMSADNVYNLYYAADKYQTNDLKKECVEYMKTTLSVYTFCDVITLALQHSESDLQKAATRFFCGNVKKIIKTVQWQTYLEDYPTSANELYIKAINA